MTKREAIKVRVGLPVVGGELPAAVRRIGAPALVSAGALYRRDAAGFPRPFRVSLPDLAGLDVALDSGGFVAWALQGGYDWTIEAYVRLAGSRSWAWWAQPDACCEPELASSSAAVRYRQAETIRLLTEARRVAAAAGVPAPLPVLQGWAPADYAWHVGQIDLSGCELVGVGSVCRRDVAGLLAVVDAIDAALPAGVRLHLFGVKSAAVALLASHPRVASVDSMAWDLRARKEARAARASNDMRRRVVALERWYAAQVAAAESSAWAPRSLPFGAPPAPLDPINDRWSALVAAGEIDAASAAHFAMLEAMEVKQ